MNPFVSLLGTAALMAAPLHPGDAAKRDRYQKMADGLAWKDFARLPGEPGVTELPGYQVEYRVHIAGGTQTNRVRIRDGNRDVYSWDEFGETAFVSRGQVIYRADYRGISSGCAIVAFDLKAGKELWKATLKGLGPIDHSKYRNRVRMEKVDDTVFAVYGEESAGKYVELVEYATGRTLGHKVFPKD